MHYSKLLRAGVVSAIALAVVVGPMPAASANDGLRTATIDSRETFGDHQVEYKGAAVNLQTSAYPVFTAFPGADVAFACSVVPIPPKEYTIVRVDCYVETATGGYWPNRTSGGGNHGAYATGAWLLTGDLDFRLCMRARITAFSVLTLGPLRCVPITI